MTRQTLQERQLSLIEHYLERLDDLSQMYVRGHDWAQEALRHFDMDWQQLQAQQQWAVRMALKDERAAEMIVAFPERASALLMQVGIQDALAWVDDALAWVDDDDIEARYRLLTTSYRLQTQRMDAPRILDVINNLEALSNQLNDDRRRSEVAQMKAEYYDTVESYADQLRWSEHALALALRVDDQELLADAYQQLGFACIRVSQFSRAEACLHKALQMFQLLNLRLKESLVRNAMAINAYNANRFDEALVHGEQALAIVREIGQRQRELTILSNLALISIGISDLEKALLYARQSWIVARETGNLNSEQTALGALIFSTSSLGLEDEMTVYIQHARDHLRKIHSQNMEAIIDFVLARQAYEHGNWIRACEIAKQASEVNRQRDSNEDEYDSMFLWGSSLIELGEFDEAAVVFSRCLELRDALPENVTIHAGALVGMSYVEARRGHIDAAQTLFDTFVTLVTQEGMKDLMHFTISIWHAYCAGSALRDSRLASLASEAERVLQKYLSHLHDESLRESFLKSNTIQRLLDVRSRL